MKQELIDQWCEALESGKYQQGTGMLRKEEDGVTKHCCLGVLADLLDPNWEEYRPDESFVGLSSAEPKLIDFNDSMGWTFPEIANWIRQNVDATE